MTSHGFGCTIKKVRKFILHKAERYLYPRQKGGRNPDDHQHRRTDRHRPQYYSGWLLRRFEEGYVLSRNPLFPHKITRYELTPDKVDCVVFCSKNYAPILPRLEEITGRFNTYFYYTITAYGRDIVPGVPPVDESIEPSSGSRRWWGKNRVAWRYDPVLLTDSAGVQRSFLKR